LPEDLLEAEHVAVAVSHFAVERAEVAARDANVGVVDVAIDDVGNDRLRVLETADGISHATKPVRWRLPIQQQRLIAGQPATSLDTRFVLAQVHGSYRRKEERKAVLSFI